MEATVGEIGSAVLPDLAGDSVSVGLWWLVLGIGVVGAVIGWVVVRRGGAR